MCVARTAPKPPSWQCLLDLSVSRVSSRVARPREGGQACFRIILNAFKNGGKAFLPVAAQTGVPPSSARNAEGVRPVGCEPLPSIRITASAGVSVFFSDDTQYLQALNRADRAMYHAKRSGKNPAARHVVAGPPGVCN